MANARHVLNLSDEQRIAEIDADIASSRGAAKEYANGRSSAAADMMRGRVDRLLDERNELKNS